MRMRYVDQGLDTVDAILPVYAPGFENDTALYIQQVKARVSQWRGGQGGGDLRDGRPNSVDVSWSDAALQSGSCPFGPGTLTDWDSGKPGPIMVAAPPGAARVVQIALNQVGKPYIWGAKGPEAFDCSGLATWSYAQIGISIPQGTGGQWPQLAPVDAAHLKPGDLVYMNTDTPVGRAVTHVGMLVGDLNGNGQWDMVHAANPSLGVRIDYDIFASSYYAPRILGFRTVR